MMDINAHLTQIANLILDQLLYASRYGGTEVKVTHMGDGSFQFKAYGYEVVMNRTIKNYYVIFEGIRLDYHKDDNQMLNQFFEKVVEEQCED